MILDALTLLGLDLKAEPSGIKRAYRAAAALAHPDLGGGVEEFTRLNDAYAEAMAWVKAQPCLHCTDGKVTSIGRSFIAGVLPCPVCGGTGKR